MPSPIYAKIPAGRHKKDLTDWFWISYKEPLNPHFVSEFFNQKDKIVVTGNLPASFLDAISSVPFIEEQGRSPDAISKTLKHKARDQWQREFDLVRGREIGIWWEKATSYMLNPVILWTPDDAQDPIIGEHVVDVNGTEKNFLELKFDPWQVESCPTCHKHFNSIIAADPEYRKVVADRLDTLRIKDSTIPVYDPLDPIYSDQCMDEGCRNYGEFLGTRPIEISDGQHRVRGTQSGDGISDDTISFSLMIGGGNSPKFDYQEAGQIFSDINIRARSLVPNHRLNMAWRYMMRDAFIWSDTNKYDFSSGTNASRAYEAILTLASGDGLPGGVSLQDNPFFSKIWTMDEDTYHDRIISVKGLFDYLFNWTTTPSHPFHAQTSNQIAEDMARYARAIADTWDGHTTGSDPLWSPNYGPLVSGTTRPTTISELKSGSPPKKWDVGAPIPDYNSGIISTIPQRAKDHSTGLRIFLSIYPAVRRDTGATRPTVTQLCSSLAKIKDLDFEQMVKGIGEGPHRWGRDFCLEIYAGVASSDSIITDKIMIDTNLGRKLGRPTGHTINHLMYEPPWLQHPMASPSTILPEAIGVSNTTHTPSHYEDQATTHITTLPTLSRTNSIEFVVPFNTANGLSVQVKLDGDALVGNGFTVQSRNKMNRNAAGLVTDGIVDNTIADIISPYETLIGHSIASGKIVHLLLSAKSEHGGEAKRAFSFKLA